ncbi:MAG: extracellular solute-binding protein [Candidatus Zixiibacteriota bacterium]
MERTTSRGGILPKLRLFVPVALALIPLCLTLSCGRGGQEVTSEGRLVVHFWQFWTEPRVKAVITKAIEEWESVNPLYKVEITDLTWSDGHQKIVAAFAGDRVPDLLELGSDWIAEFAARGALMDMSAECEQWHDSLAGWPPAIYDNSCWALPWYLSTRVLYFNQDIAKLTQGGNPRPPMTWDELLQQTRDATTEKPRLWGIGINAAEPHVLYKKFVPFLWSAGGDILTEDQSVCALETEAGRRSLQFLVDLSRGQLVEKQAALDEAFINGKLLFDLSGDWLYEKLKRSGSNVAYSAFMMPFPAPDQGTRTSFAGGEYLAIPRRAKQPVAAVSLARHLLSEKNIFNLCLATGCATPVHINVARNAYFADDSIRSVFIRQMGQARTSPANPHWVEIEAALEWGVEQALYGKLSVDDALAATCEKINAILSKKEDEKR